MLYIFCGPSCSGKSSAAGAVRRKLNAQIYTGKDYLSLANEENMAWDEFKKILNMSLMPRCNVIYIITEKDRLSELRQWKNVKICRFEADLNILEERFAKRTSGKLPQSISDMLKRQTQVWMNESADLVIDTSKCSEAFVLKKLEKFVDF